MAARLKVPVTPVPKTLEEAEHLAGELGELMRMLDRQNSRLSSDVAALQVQSKAVTAPIGKEIDAKFKALTAFAQAHRHEILPPKTKSIVIAAGTMGWRLGNKKVVIAEGMEEAVLDFLAEHAPHFVREKQELDKEALIGAAALPEGLEHVSIVQAETFYFKPLNVDLEKTRATGTLPAEKDAA